MSRRHSVSILPTRKLHRRREHWQPQPSMGMRPRRLLMLIVGGLLLLLGWFGWNTVEQRAVYIANQWTPASVHGIWNTADQSRVRWTTKCPTVVPGVHAATWAGGWDTPRLRKPTSTDLGPAILMLHIFSIPNTASRLRRELIRKHHPLFALPEEYRHLVDVKFVLGFPREECRGRVNEALCPGVAEEEREIEAERRHGDLIRLEGLKNGENMDEGKTWEWIRHVGREGGREAQWLFKCDDDTLPIVQNLLPFLLSLDPSVPTYLGQAWLDKSFYLMLGYMYGMNWGVVTLEDIQYPIAEDVRTSQLLLSLPPIPHHHNPPHQHNDPGKHHRPSHNPYVYIPPPSPRTGLIRVDIRGYLSNYGGVDAFPGNKAFGWHNLKSDKLYEEAWAVARKDLVSKGREVWVPPQGLEFLAQET